MLHKLPSDVVHFLCRLLDTQDCVRLSQVTALEDCTWTRLVRRRGGLHWMKGKRGFLRLMEAAYAPMLKPLQDNRRVAASSFAAYMTRPQTLTGNLHGMSVTCLAAVDNSTMAVGHDYGVYVYSERTMTPVWLGVRVNSVAYVKNNRLWIGTSQNSALELDMEDMRLSNIQCADHVYCVSGPIAMVGTSKGTWPHCGTRNVPCTHIVQSDVVIAAWHISGDVSVVSARTTQLLYMIDTGKRSMYGSRALSVIGDIIRVAGIAWSDKCCTGRCPNDSRHASSDGQHVYSSSNGYIGVNSA